MAVRSATTYKGMYTADMSLDKINSILAVRDMKEVENLKHCIFNFPPEMILDNLDKPYSIREELKAKGEDSSKYLGTMRDYQTVGTAFMYLSPKSVIGDFCGLGKTVEIAALINFLRMKGECRRFLMCVENSAIGQTVAELIKFTGLKIIGTDTDKRKLEKTMLRTDWGKVDGLVVKHSALKSDAFSLWVSRTVDAETNTSRLYDTFILDESSLIKNNTTKTYEYTKNLCDLAKRVHLMNATTFETSIIDIYNQMDMMYPTLLPSKWKIEQRYRTYGRDSYWKSEPDEHGVYKPVQKWHRVPTGYQNQEEFKNSLKLVYFARTKKDVGLDTPSVYKVYDGIEPTKEQKIAIANGHRYNEVLNCPSLIPEINIPTSAKTVPKIAKLISLVNSEFNDSSIMIYCFHREAQRVIKEELEGIGRRPVILNGEVTDTAERYKIQEDFNNGTYDIIITNAKKSLNLYGGDVCIFFSSVTNPAVTAQIASRIDRNVDDKAKTFVLLLYKDTDELAFFLNKTKNRAKDARELTVDAKTTVDFFIDSMKEE